MNKVNVASMSKTKYMTRIAMLCAISFVLGYFQIPLTFVAPDFIKLDLADLPVLLGSFTLGPVAAIIISALKNILSLVIKGTQTAGIGELSNFIVGCALSVTAGVIYLKNRTFKGAILSLIAGTILMTTVAVLSNYYVVFPLYSNVYPMEALIELGHAITPKINTLWDMMLYSIVPFNLIKGFTVSLVTVLIYKRIRPLLKN